MKCKYEYKLRHVMSVHYEELGGPAVSAVGVRSRKLTNVLKGHRMGDQNLLSRAPRCFRRHVEPLVPASFGIVICILAYYARGFDSRTVQSFECMIKSATRSGYFLCIICTYTPLTFYPRRGSRGNSDILPRRPRFAKII
jgi:hypothetical protein